MGWLVLLDTGLAHRHGVGVMVFSVVIVAVSVAVAWWWLGNWQKFAG
jgi:heme/copper-type cytochrome/quinol oxidase subunit 4